MSHPSNPLDEAMGLADGAGGLAPGRFVLVEDCVETSGACVLHHLIKRALSSQGGGDLIFLAFAHPFSHYDRILRKMGCNLSTNKDNGRLHFFDMLRLEFHGQKEGKIENSAIEDGLVELYRKIQRAAEVSSSHEYNKTHCTIMIDDLSHLEIAANGSVDHVLNFVHYCITLTSEQDCSLVILNHEDIYTSEETSSLLSHLDFLADIVIKAEPLATGLAADVHGQLTIVNKGTFSRDGHLMNKLHNFHIKVKENGVECFYPGSRA